MQGSTRRRGVFAIVAMAVSAALILLIFSSYFIFQQSSNTTIDQISEAYLAELSNTEVENFNSKTTSRMYELGMIEEALIAASPVDEAYLQDLLDREASVNDISTLFVLMSDGGCYSSFGSYYTACPPEVAQEAASMSFDVYSGKTLLGLGIQADPNLIYYVLPIEPIPFQNTSMAVLAFGVDGATLERSIGNTTGAARASIVMKDGTYIVFSGVYASGKPGDNFFTLLEEGVEYDGGGSTQGFRDAIENDVPYMASAHYNGGHVYLYVTPLDSTDWYLLTVMPYSVIDTPIGELTGTLVMYTVIILAAIIIAVLIFSYLYNLSTKLNRSLLQEEMERAEEALEKAKHADMAKSEFLSRMSHEIRTPLNGVIGMTNIALNSIGDDEKVAESLKKVELSSKHLLSIINDILDMSKIESGRMVIISEEFDFKNFVESLTTVFYSQAREQGVKFETVMVDIVSEVMVADSLRLNQILYNLLSNALKFTEAGGSVTLRIYIEKETRPLPIDDGTEDSGELMEETSPEWSLDYRWLCFEVIDTGSGIAEENLEKIFSSFEQAEPGITHRYGGTGLGLPITKHFAEMMGGTVSVESEHGKGSTFTVKVPYHPVDQAETLPDLSEKSAIVVEGNHEAAKYAAKLLALFGIEAKTCFDGFEAIGEIRRVRAMGEEYDICLADLGTPHFEELTQARQTRATYGIAYPGLLLSSTFDSEAEGEASKKLGIARILSKPIFLSDLLPLLENMEEISEEAAIAMRQVGSTEPKSAKAKKEGGANSPGYDFSGRRVLLVEDNDLNLEILVELLQVTGASIDVAGDGQEAVEKFTASEAGYYDMIFMDVQMPVMDGYEATKVIRALDRPDAHTVAIFAMTANAFIEDRRRSLAMGMNGHISKPIDIRVVYGMMDEFFSGSKEK